ncbi:hypothetical protein [Prosthecochloris sp. ZM]|uniref:hypothetical protein n=1 Tax=Prosthecochloris sp. ZM TaxID=2283143 RepID=UPI0011C081EF|nr:hypothetical protein [Prosthecochloris sp. ZM]
MIILLGLSMTGDRVYRSRVHPMAPGTMPGLCVYAGQERNTGRGTLRATEKAVELTFDAYASGAEYDDEVESIHAEVEGALFSDFSDGRYFSGLVTNLEYLRSESQYFGEAATKYGVLRMIYEATYKTIDGNAETAL